jgi:hypothetical protein
MVFVKEVFKREIIKLIKDYCNTNEKIIADLLKNIEDVSIEDRDLNFSYELKNNFESILKNQDFYITACKDFREYSNKGEALRNELLQFIKKQNNFVPKFSGYFYNSPNNMITTCPSSLLHEI